MGRLSCVDLKSEVFEVIVVLGTTGVGGGFRD